MTRKQSFPNKSFIIQYDPTATPAEMFRGFWEAVEKDKKSIQPKNLMVVGSIETIYKIMTEPRLEIFYAISEKKPKNINQLAEVLGKNSANV
jgi:predicted transcriptional regulator